MECPGSFSHGAPAPVVKMSLFFLNPWLWLGALAVAVPVWLHLRRKTERNLVRFSAVRFLEDQPRAARTPLRLRNLLLLLLRVLAVLLITAAFSWPCLRRFHGLPVKESVVYILDNTLSRQANDGFNTDRARLTQELSKAAPEQQVAVIELASTPRLLVSFADDRLSARQKVHELQPTFERGSYLAAFREANALLANSLGQNRRIVLLGDNQANQWNENLNAPPFLGNVQLDLPQPGPAQLPNLWLTELRAQRIFLGDKSIVNFTMRLGHLGPASVARVVLRVNDRPVFSRTVSLENQPQSILLQAQCEAEPASWLCAEATVEGTPDVLQADNHVFCSVPPVVEGKVALLAQSPYLRMALSPEVMRGQWLTRFLDPARLGAEVAANQDAEVLCIESGYLQSPDARTLVKRYLANGRGVFLLVDRLSPSIDGCLRELGFEADRAPAPEEPNPERFQFVLFNHAIFHPFQSRDFGNLLDIKVHNCARLKAISGKPLIFSGTGAGLFFEGAAHSGKLFVCAFGLDRAQTSWPVHPTFIPFLDLTLQAARPQESTITSFQPGETTTIQLPAVVSAHEVFLKANGREVQRATVDHGRAQIRMPRQPGLYAMTYGESEEIQRIFSINPSPKESELLFVDAPKAVKGWCFEASHGLRPALSAPPARMGSSAILQQWLWWWMLLGGLLALTFETVLTAAKGETS